MAKTDKELLAEAHATLKLREKTAITCGECGTDDMTGRTGLMHDTSGRRCYRICGECRKWHEREGTYTG